MPMYNLLEFSGNDFITSGSVWNYYGDEINDDANENNAAHNNINNNKTITSKSFKYKTKLTGRAPNNNNNNNILDTDVVVPVKYLSNFGDLLIFHWLAVKQNLICHGQKNV